MKQINITPIDMTPTWGEWGNIYRRFAECGETLAVKHLAEDFARAMASCEALKAIVPMLTEEQKEVVARTLTAEITKQGF